MDKCKTVPKWWRDNTEKLSTSYATTTTLSLHYSFWCIWEYSFTTKNNNNNKKHNIYNLVECWPRSKAEHYYNNERLCRSRCEEDTDIHIFAILLIKKKKTKPHNILMYNCCFKCTYKSLKVETKVQQVVFFLLFFSLYINKFCNEHDTTTTYLTKEYFNFE